MLLALTGLVVWVVHLLSGSASWGWAAVEILAVMTRILVLLATLGL